MQCNSVVKYILLYFCLFLSLFLFVNEDFSSNACYRKVLIS